MRASPVANPAAPLPSAVRLPTDAELLRLLRENLGATVSIIGIDLRFCFVNDGFAAALGMDPKAMIGMTLEQVYGAAHHEAYMPYILRALSGETVSYERLGRTRLVDGLWRTVSLRPWRDVNGTIIGVVSTSMIVHELKASAEALRAANERLSSHMENSPLAVIELDADLRITHCSSRIAQMLGLDPHALVGQGLWEALSENRDQGALKAAFARLQAGGEARTRVESTHRHPLGETVHCEWFVSALTNTHGELTSIMALVEDISLRVKAESQLRHIALHDQLTGLPNRSALAERLIASLTRSNRTQERVALLFIDLDGFKRVNDIFGHASGDETLREVARRLQSAVRETDVVARIGGDEFVVLLETEVLEGTPDLVCSRIFEALKPMIRFANGEAPIGASIGVAMHPPINSAADDMLRRADAAMYEAKHAGKGCVRYASA